MDLCDKISISINDLQCITSSTARHQTIAGKEIRAEQSQINAMKIAALFGVIREGYVIGSVIAQYLSVEYIFKCV